MLWIVVKQPVDLDVQEIVGVFTSERLAHAACCGAGNYLIAKVTPDRAYRSGTLLSVVMKCIVSPRSIGLG